MSRTTGAGKGHAPRGSRKTRDDIANSRAESGTIDVAPDASQPPPLTGKVASVTLREVAAPVGAFQGPAGKTVLAYHTQQTVPMSPEVMRTLRVASASPDADPYGGRYSIRAPQSGRTEMPLATPTIAPHAWSPENPNAEEASQHHDAATALIKQRRWNHALEEALRAVHLDSSNPHYETTYAWILYQAGPPRRETDAQISAHLNRALKLHRECAQAHYVLGMLRKRQGKHQAAEAHFRMTLESEPEHLEAEREMRLYAKRRANPTGESGLMQRIVDSLTSKRGRTSSRRRSKG